jgi:hypothetical protein
MENDRDFDWAKCKVPRKDKGGNDITSDKLGAGGRHRDDGTYSGVAYDIEMIDENDDLKEKNYYQANQSTPYESRKAHEEVELSKEQKELAALIGEVIAAGALWVFNEVVAPYAKRFWKEKAAPGLKGVWNGLTNKKATIQSSKGEIKSPVHTTAELKASNSTNVEPFSKANKSYEEYRESISKEEAQRIFHNMRNHAILLANDIRRLSNACIREEDESSEAFFARKSEIERLTAQEVMNSIKLLLDNQNRILLDEATTRVLSDFYAGNLIIESVPVPIEKYMTITTHEEKNR